MSNTAVRLDTPEKQATRWISYGYQDRLANLPASPSVPAEYRKDYDQGYWEADFILRTEAPEDTQPAALQPIDTDSYPQQIPYPTCGVCGEADCSVEHFLTLETKYYTPATDADGNPICGTCGGAVATWAPGSPEPCQCPIDNDALLRVCGNPANVGGFDDEDDEPISNQLSAGDWRWLRDEMVAEELNTLVIDGTPLELSDMVRRMDEAERKELQDKILAAALFNARTAYICQALVVAAFAFVAAAIIALPLIAK